MELSVSETILQETEPVLQLKRSLLAIDEYAASKGVSRTVVEECGRLGIVQIRKYKGKVFVVDVPCRPYSHSPETTDKNMQLADKGDQPQRLSESGRTRQFTVVLLIPFLFAVLFACLWLYLDRKVQIDRLEQSYAGIQQLANDSMEAERKTKTIKDMLRAYETEVERLKGELVKSQAEVNAVRNELTRTRQSFETIQSNNAEVVNWLDEQIQELTEQLYELLENRQAPRHQKY